MSIILVTNNVIRDTFWILYYSSVCYYWLWFLVSRQNTCWLLGERAPLVIRSTWTSTGVCCFRTALTDFRISLDRGDPQRSMVSCVRPVFSLVSLFDRIAIFSLYGRRSQQWRVRVHYFRGRLAFDLVRRPVESKPSPFLWPFRGHRITFYTQS